ncbi:response regulator [Paenibacillus agaridevorans]|uniref:response regulator n=1 Tax=Paenibacillus agaridevorans TaxID=171404 RepID=UPI001BE41987|nr:response regulator [Paenibacillus agaridevorans]
MHKVLLIDDDVPMLKLLQQMLPWEDMQLRVVGATYSSAKALHLFKETMPDIVITDIGLPQKNGLELAAAFAELKPDVRLIFLTCHEDFHYAQQAVKLNADDYLLKDQLTAEQLKQSLRKALRLLKAKATRLEPEVTGYSTELYKHGLFQRVLHGLESDATREQAAQLGVSWSYPWFMFSIVHVNYITFDEHYDHGDLSLVLYAVYNIAQELAEPHEGVTVFLLGDHLVVLHNFRVNLARNAELQLSKFVQELRLQCERVLKLRLSIMSMTDKLELRGIGSVYQQLLHGKFEFYEGDDLVAPDLGGLLQHMFLQAPPRFLEHFKPGLERALLVQDANALSDIVRQMGEAARQQRTEPDQFIRDVVYLLRRMEMMFAESMRDESLYDYLSLTRTIADASALTVRKLVEISGTPKHGSEKAVQEPKLQVIQQFIDRHLSENITSIDIARYLYLNPSYFSRYFKRLTGVNFTDYVHQYKMKIAAKMLKSSDQTLESLAIGLGYSERTYFSKVFKKYIGISPSEYKLKHAAPGKNAK